MASALDKCRKIHLELYKINLKAYMAWINKYDKSLDLMIYDESGCKKLAQWSRDLKKTAKDIGLSETEEFAIYREVGIL